MVSGRTCPMHQWHWPCFAYLTFHNHACFFSTHDTSTFPYPVQYWTWFLSPRGSAHSTTTSLRWTGPLDWAPSMQVSLSAWWYVYLTLHVFSQLTNELMSSLPDSFLSHECRADCWSSRAETIPLLAVLNIFSVSTLHKHADFVKAEILTEGDEVEAYRNYCYISASEAVWRLLLYVPIHWNVDQLSAPLHLHLPTEQLVLLDDTQSVLPTANRWTNEIPTTTVLYNAVICKTTSS